MTAGRRFWQLMAPMLMALACGCVPEGFPDDPMADTESDLEQPVIVPVQPILDLALSPEETPDAEDPDPALRQRGEDLRARLDAASATAVPTSDFDDELQARSGALRSRADAVRAATPE